MNDVDVETIIGFAICQVREALENSLPQLRMFFSFMLAPTT